MQLLALLELAPSATTISAFQRISSFQRRRLAAGSRLPNSTSLPSCMLDMSQIISLRVSKKACFAWIQRKRALQAAAVAASPASVAAAKSRTHRSRWCLRPLRKFFKYGYEPT